MVKSRRNASSSGVPNVLSRWIRCSPSGRRLASGDRDAVLHDFFAGLHLPAERGDLDDLLPELDVREPEAAADDPAVAEELLDLIGMRRRADVEILGPAAEQQIAHAAADEVGDVIGLAQPVEDLQGIGVDVAARERVLCARDDPGLDHGRALYQMPVPSAG